MRRFADLLDALAFSAARNAKLRLLAEYFRTTPDPDRGWALAALTGALSFREAKPALIRELVSSRVDAELFKLSYDFVGDLAETAALIWPTQGLANASPDLDEIVTGLRSEGRARIAGKIVEWLDRLDATGRWALLKLITGSLRVGVSARLAKTALADAFGKPLDDVEEVWHSLTPPYAELFSWLADPDAPRPDTGAQPVFRPVMLAHPLEAGELEKLDPQQFRAEWKWDGIRVQLVSVGGQKRLYSRTGDDIGGAFPDVLEAMDFEGVLDGELLVGQGGIVAPFNDLQQRLNRKSVSAALVRTYPAFVRLYDVLMLGGEDCRPLSFDERRALLKATVPFDVSPLIPFASWEELAEQRAAPPSSAIEGVMLKRADSPYLAGRPKGPWFKWKRDPFVADCVLMYAQRGHGKRSSFYSDFTFGAWNGETLVPVGKAYFGFTDAELVELDKFVRANTVNRFGPVREVTPKLVLEVAFDSIARSKRHKSGVAMRFPRISRIRWDKPAAEADRVENLEALIEGAVA
ncbi:cisplatin damage response ATP-dependent DNA ligase [Lacibacterium aquatile]|uniref:DNA ligase (ATP) n=1 Tax=Lacibacterium aquatile TaxID=1168082 RepID=A0ABW5DSR5_9PROT